MSPRPFGRPGYRKPDLQTSVVRAKRRPREPHQPTAEQAPAPPAIPPGESEPSPVQLVRGDNGRPTCPGCLSSARVDEGGWCSRCVGWVTALQPPPGKHYPDFE